MSGRLMNEFHHLTTNCAAQLVEEFILVDGSYSELIYWFKAGFLLISLGIFSMQDTKDDFTQSDIELMQG